MSRKGGGAYTLCTGCLVLAEQIRADVIAQDQLVLQTLYHQQPKKPCRPCSVSAAGDEQKGMRVVK